MVFGATPIPSVERIPPDHIQCASNPLAISARENEQNIVAQCLLRQLKKGPCQIRGSPFSRPRILIKSPERIPMLGLNIVSRQVNDFNILDGLGPFFPDRFSLAR